MPPGTPGGDPCAEFVDRPEGAAAEMDRLRDPSGRVERSHGPLGDAKKRPDFLRSDQERSSRCRILGLVSFHGVEPNDAQRRVAGRIGSCGRRAAPSGAGSRRARRQDARYHVAPSST